MTSMWHNLAFVTQLNARTDRQQSRWRQNCSRQSRLPVSQHTGLQPANLSVVVCSCLEETQSDYVEFSNFNIHLIDRKMKRLCGSDHQQIVVHSDGSFFRVTFRSNDVYESTGFKAAYQFRAIEGTRHSLLLSQTQNCLCHLINSYMNQL